jgi:uncharacterized protein involved in exopolysaccharide biosynthesis
MSTAEQLKQYEELAAGALLIGRDRHASAIMALLADVDRLRKQRDALAAELAQARAQLAAVPDVRNMSVGQLQVIRDAATNRLYEVYCAGLEQA